MKKRIVSFIAVLAMVTSLLPVFELPAMAEGTWDGTTANGPDTGFISSASAELAGTENFVHDGITFTKWDETDSLPATEGNYYLTGDVTLSEVYTAPDAEIAICLNGYKITQSDNNKTIVIKDAKGKLTVYNDYNETGKLYRIGIFGDGDDEPYLSLYTNAGNVSKSVIRGYMDEDIFLRQYSHLIPKNGNIPDDLIDMTDGSVTVSDANLDYTAVNVETSNATGVSDARLVTVHGSAGSLALARLVKTSAAYLQGELEFTLPDALPLGLDASVGEYGSLNVAAASAVGEYTLTVTAERKTAYGIFNLAGVNSFDTLTNKADFTVKIFVIDEPEGDGSEEHPYLIPDAATLEYFRDKINKDMGDNWHDKSYALTADIELEGSADNQWMPIGFYNSSYDNQAFDGVFDGRGHTVSGLYINNPEADYQGLFGYSTGHIRNVMVEGAVTGRDYVGGIAGYAGNNTITACANKASVSGEKRVGGIAGDAYEVTNSYSTGDITGTQNTGAITGYCANASQACYYLENTADKGDGNINSDGSDDMEQGQAAFGAGVVAYYLNGNLNSSTERVWGQEIGKDAYPVFLTGENTIDSAVYRMKFMRNFNSDRWAGDAAVKAGADAANPENPSYPKTVYITAVYANLGDYYTLTPIFADEDAEEEFKAAVAWVLNPKNAADETKHITANGNALMCAGADITVYAVEDTNNAKTASDGSVILLKSSEAQNIDLNQYIGTADNEALNDEITFSITGINPLSGAEINGNNLVIPANAAEGTYAFNITAARHPDFKLMSAEFSNNTADFTVTVKLYDLAGDGSGENPYQISSAEKLEYIRGRINADTGGNVWADKYYIVTADIDLENTEWTPINGFNGHLDGGKHTISGLGAEDKLINAAGENAVITLLAVDNGVIVSANGGTIENCLNTSGKITGTNTGKIKNCFSTAENTGGTVENCYTSDLSGEAAYKLQKGQPGLVWGQDLGENGDATPVLTSNTAKRVYKAEFMVKNPDEAGGYITITEAGKINPIYGNSDDEITYPAFSEEAISDFAYWTDDVSDIETEYDETSFADGDITLYAVRWESLGSFDRKNDTFVRRLVKGDGCVINLSETMQYAENIATAGQFTYTITAGNDTLGAVIDGDTLTVPQAAGAGTYTLNVSATEKGVFRLASAQTKGFAIKVVVADFGNGDGSENDPYILNAGNIRDFHDMVVNGEEFEDKYFEVREDIDLGGIDENGERVNGSEWTRNDTTAESFRNVFGGTLDGNYHTINGMYCYLTNVPAGNDVGFIGTNNGTIKNLGISGYVRGYSDVGGIAGRNSGTIESCWFEGDIESVYGNAGGITGRNEGEIKDCYSIGAVTGDEGSSRIGGIAGYNHEDATIESCFRKGAVTTGAGGKFAGGIAGAVYGAVDGSNGVTNCYYGEDDAAVGIGGSYINDEEAAADNTASTVKLPSANITGYKGAALAGALNIGHNGDVWFEGKEHPVLAEHIHDWLYTASESTISRRCLKYDCIFENGDGGSLTIHAPGNTVYQEGISHNAWLDRDIVFDVNVTLADVVYEYKASEDGSYEAVTEEFAKTVNAGFYKASLTVEGKTLYVEYEVQKATPSSDSYTVPKDITAIAGTKLSDIELPGGITWQSPEQILEESGKYNAVFTPSDTLNYRSVALQIPIEVHDGTAEITGDAGAVVDASALGEIARKMALETGADVTLRLGVNKLDPQTGDAELKDIVNAFGAVKDIPPHVDIYDITLQRTVTDKAGSLTDEPSTIDGGMLLISFNIDSDALAADSVRVMRYDAASVTELKEKTEAGENEDYYEYSDGQVTIAANKFGAYAIAYKETTDPTPAPSVRTSGGANSNRSSSATPKPTPVAAPSATDAPLSEASPTPSPADNDGWWYVDVPEAQWYYSLIKTVTGKGLMTGVWNGENADEFRPDNDISRAMLITVLYRIEGEPETQLDYTFEDILKGWYYEQAVAWGSANGIISGYSDKEYAPDDAVTREQMAAILWRYAKYKGIATTYAENTGILSYNDAEAVSGYAETSMRWACGMGIVSGYTDNTLRPQANLTRAQAAAVLDKIDDIVNKN